MNHMCVIALHVRDITYLVRYISAARVFNNYYIYIRARNDTVKVHLEIICNGSIAGRPRAHSRTYIYILILYCASLIYYYLHRSEVA